MAHVELAGLTKRYGDVTAVDNVSLSLEKGLLLCLLGPSGCGKTSTLRLIAGFVQPTAGEIRVGNRTISSPGWAEPPERRNMSMIFQSYALWPHMTVAENVAYGLQLRRLPKSEIETKVSAILGVTRLAALGSRYPAELSGGQQQRVSLARALVVEPDILLLDEPLSNLDANLREEMRFEIRRLHDETRYTTVYVTHDQTEAMTAADIIAVMNEGRVEQAGTPEEIYKKPRSQFVARFIGGTNIFRGTIRDGAVICEGGLVLRCVNPSEANAGEAFVSIRQHDVEISAEEPDASTNRVIGTVSRQVYLGSHRDYLIMLNSGIAVRALATEAVAMPEGEQVWLHFPPECCRALSH
jgi:iron(III) transport system ATP-binding protein